MLLNAIIGNNSLIEIIMGIVSALVVIFITLPVHEWAHGFMSTKLGDPTPRYQGRLTLNPMAHFDPIGAAGILLFGIGWAKPSRLDSRYYKNQKSGVILVALAGPLANVFCAFVSLFLFQIVQTVFILAPLPEASYSILFAVNIFFMTVAQINVYLALYNLMPLPPFDGAKILFTFLPQRYYFKIMQYERFIFLGILVLLYTGILSRPLNLASNAVLAVIGGLAKLPFSLFFNLIGM